MYRQYYVREQVSVPFLRYTVELVKSTDCRFKPCFEQYRGGVELTVLLALTMQHLLAVPLFTSSFLFHSVIINSAKQDGMLSPDKVTPRGGR